VLRQAEIDSMMNDPGWKGGNYDENPARVANAEFGVLVLRTPQRYNRLATRKQALVSLEKEKTEPAFDANNHRRQAQAMMSLDVSDTFAGSMEKAADAVKAKVLVVVSMQDHSVTPGPALDFGKQIHAGILMLDSDCGHQLMSCDHDQVVGAVASFVVSGRVVPASDPDRRTPASDRAVGLKQPDRASRAACLVLPVLQ